MEDSLQISFLAVIVAAVVNFFIGFLWYTPLFGKIWAKEIGMDMSQPIDPKIMRKIMIRGMSLALLGQFLMAFVLAHNNAAWSFVPGMANSTAVSIILNSAIFTWLGFFLPTNLSRVAWEGKSWTLFAIDSGYQLATLLAAASILTLMR